MQTLIATALKNFAKFSDLKLLEFTSVVIDALRGNVYFTTVDNERQAAEDALDVFTEALNKAKVGNASQKAAKNAAKKALVAKLRILCDAVNDAQRGNRVALLTSGFEVSKETSQPSQLEALKKFSVVGGSNPGELEVVISKGAGTVSVVYQYSIDEVVDDKTVWQTIGSTERKCLIAGLPQGKIVFIRVGVIGTRKQYIFTEPLRKVVDVAEAA